MEGDVTVLGMNTREYDVPYFAPHLGMVFQDPGYQMVTGDVESEIAFGLEIQNFPERLIRSRLDQIARLLRIGHLMGRTINDLSWGERQRVAIASVLAIRPSLLVMDEPFSGIDTSTSLNLAEILADLNKNLGTTILIFEHRTAYLSSLVGRRIVMDEGQIIADEKPDPDPGVRNGRPIQPVVIPHFGAEGSPTYQNPTELHPNPCTAPNPAVPALSLKDVVYRYPGGRSPVLDQISLDFYPGEVTIITGANGAGKTTLLKHCNGLITPDRGSVLLGSDPISQKTIAATARTVGLLNQHADYQLFEGTIAEELAFGPRNLGKTEEMIAGIIRKIRQQCSLDHIDPLAPPLGLSGGEKQRVALAGILAMETPVVILDEPTFGLDSGLKHALTGLLRSLCDAGKTVVIATHDEEFAEACGDRFIRITAGQIESDCRNPPRSACKTNIFGKSGNPPGGGTSGES
jgi:energy-coupling factor transport system ATP-binding protein